MNRPSLEIEALRSDGVGEAAELLSESHHDYPAFRHVFPDPRRRKRALRVAFAGVVRDAVPFGTAEAARGPNRRLLGVAVWLPPGAFPWSHPRKLRAGATFVRVAAIAPGSALAFMRTGANAERAHPRDAHWYLEVMGVRPEAQGQGVGSRLVTGALQRADSQQLPCYLETSRGDNLGFYERFGFRAVNDSLALVPGGPTHWAMVRPSRTVSST